MDRTASEQLSERLGTETWLTWAFAICLRWPYLETGLLQPWAEATAEIERLGREREKSSGPKVDQQKGCEPKEEEDG